MKPSGVELLLLTREMLGGPFIHLVIHTAHDGQRLKEPYAETISKEHTNRFNPCHERKTSKASERTRFAEGVIKYTATPLHKAATSTFY